MAEHDIGLVFDFLADEINHWLSVDEIAVAYSFRETCADEHVVEFAELFAAGRIFWGEFHDAVDGEGVSAPTFAERDVVVWDSRGDFGVVKH